VWIATAVTRRLPSVGGRLDAGLGLVGTGALIWWAADELWRGVNPCRRLLGLAVLLGIAVSAAR